MEENKNTLQNKSVSRPYKGLYTDSSKLDQPEGTYTFALNAKQISSSGDSNKLSREESNSLEFLLPKGFTILGKTYMSNNTYAVFLTDNIVSHIGIVDFNKKEYVIFMSDENSSEKLNFSSQYPIDVTYRLRRSSDRVVYFTDNLNRPRYFNFDKPEDFKSYTGNDTPLDYLDIDKYWNPSKFNLVKTFEKIPKYKSIEVIEGGSLKSGSYNVGGIQYLDSDLTPTEWLNPSDTIVIFKDSQTNLSFGYVRGSTNEVNEYQNFGSTTKAIRVELDNLDSENYPFYRLSFTEATNGSGEISKVVYTDPIPTDEPIFTYDGNNASVEGLAEELALFTNDISKAKNIEQIENRLILSNVESSGINLCNLQSFASKIKSNVSIKNVVLNNIEASANPKNPSVHNFIGDETDSLGYMPGEIYSFGIVYVFANGVHSPVYHIPGKNPKDTSSLMSSNNELEDFTYTSLSDCNKPLTSWGKDSEGDDLQGSKIRHHRFPTRKELDSNQTNRRTSNKNFSIASRKLTPVKEYSLYIKQDPNALPNYLSEGFSDTTVRYRVSYESNNVTYSTTGFFDISNFEPRIGISRVLVSTRNNNFRAVSIVQIDSEDNVLELNSGIKLTHEIEQSDVSGEDGTTTTNILGVNFSNIEIPNKELIGEEIIGYYIVQNRREESDKTILDTGIGLPVCTEETGAYEAAGFFNPNQGQTTSDTKVITLFGKDITIPNFETDTVLNTSKNRWAIWHPENAFNKKEYSQANVKVLEHLEIDGVSVHGQEIQDVQPGTSYNSERHRKSERDTDGYSLYALSRASKLFSKADKDSNNRIEQDYNNSNNSFENNAKIDYLNPLHSYDREINGETKSIFNLASDLRLGIVSIQQDKSLNENYFNTNRRPLVALTREVRNPYSNFRNKPYYKSSKNMQEATDSSVDIFGGDTYISSATITSSMFSDIRLRKRKGKKKQWWKIALGVVLAVAAIVLTGGAAAIGIAAIGAGLAVKGVSDMVKIDKINEVYNDLYEKGLRNTVHDALTGHYFEPNPPDDTIQWFSDTIQNVYFESTVNMNWRVGSTGEVPDFPNSPYNYETSYFSDRLVNKLTVLDSENDSGRLYQGFCNIDIYEVNKDYERREAQKPFFHLPLEYDCCSDNNEKFPHRVFFSEQAFQEELTDNYRNFLPLSYRDLEGNTGSITNMFRLKNNLYIHTEESLWHLPQNIQERVTGDIVSFIGTGSFFSIPPRKVVDSDFGLSAGIQHKWSTTKTPYGIYFISQNQQNIYQFDGSSLKALNLKGIDRWAKENLVLKMEDFFAENGFSQYQFRDLPYLPIGTGYTIGYDNVNTRILVSKRDYINPEILFKETEKDFALTIYNNILYKTVNISEQIENLGPGWEFKDTFEGFIRAVKYNEQSPYIEVSNLTRRSVNPQNLKQNHFTLSYNLKTDSWESFMSFEPVHYFTTGKNLYTVNGGYTGLWKHGSNTSFGNYYNIPHPYIVEYVKIENPLVEKFWDSLGIITDALEYSENEKEWVNKLDTTFNKAVLYTDTDITGSLTLVPKKDNVIDGSNWFSQNPSNIELNKVYLKRSNNSWNLNDLRNNIKDSTKPMFTSNKNNIDSSFFIDKQVKEDNIDFNKPWQEVTPLKGRYLAVRLIFDNFENINLLLNYSTESSTTSIK